MAGEIIEPQSYMAAEAPVVSTKLTEFRAKYGTAYDKVDDATLADALYNKHYATKMDRRDFDARMGIKPYADDVSSTITAIGNAPTHVQMGVTGIRQMTSENNVEGLTKPYTVQDVQAGPYGRDLVTWGMSKVDPTLSYLNEPDRGAAYQDRLAKIAELANTPEGRADFLKTNGLDTQLEQAQATATESAATYADQKATLRDPDARPGSPGYYVSGAVGSMAEMAPGLALSILTKNPIPAMVNIGALVGGTSYADARVEGMDAETAQQYAALYAAAEAIPEALPLGELLKPGVSFLTRLVKTGMAETVQEVLTEAIQIGIDKGYLTPEMTWGEMRGTQRLMDAGVMAAIAGPLMGAAAHPIHRAVDATVEATKTFIQTVFPQVAQVEQPKPAEPTMIDRINAELKKRGMSPVPEPEPVIQTVSDGSEAPAAPGEVAPPAIQAPAGAAEAASPVAPAGGTEAPAEANAAPGANTGDFSPAAVISHFEGFRTHAYWDVNHWRVGYGSDTYTTEDGKVHSVTKNTVIDEDGAKRDLARRIPEFEQSIRKEVGEEAWAALPAGAQSALNSITYNYGNLPNGVAAAVRTGDLETIAQAIEARGSDNGGVNKGRREQEAALVRGGGLPAGGVGPVENSPGAAQVPGLALDEVAAGTEPATEPGAITPPTLESVAAEEAAKQEEATKQSTPAAPIAVETKDDLTTAATDVNLEPTEAQKEAGNYQKGHVQLEGLDITIENPKGTERTGTDPSGRAWSVTMPGHYGYIKRTEGADGDHVDVYIGDTPNNHLAFVVDQLDADTGKFDEHKVILGVNNVAEAKLLYEAGFSDGRAKERIGNITGMTMPGFKKWLAEGDQTKPVGKVVKPKKPTEKIPGLHDDADMEARGKIKTGDRVQYTDTAFDPPRIVTGTVRKPHAAFKGTGIVEVDLDRGGDVSIKASKLRPHTEESDNGKSGSVADEAAGAPEGVQPGDVSRPETGREAGDVSRPEGGRGSEGGGKQAPGRDAGSGSDLGRDEGVAADTGAGERPADGPAGAAKASRADRAGLTPTDYRIPDPSVIGSGGAVAKFEGNLKAIEIIKALDERLATDDEKAALSRYVGWGGLQQAFKRPDGTYADGWEARARRLEESLTPEEYETARQSTQYAHYTAPEVVNAMWAAVQRLGFGAGRVLEPSVGTGNFLGLRPATIDPQFHAVEFDNITAAIAKALYAKARVIHQGFQDFIAPDGYYDLAIGNPPFGSQKLYDAKRTKLNDFSLHNFFFAKSVDLLRPDGVLAMVVTNSFMDAVVKDKARAYIAERAELLGAIRLPNTAFAKNAGTEVTTDIVFLRRLKEGETSTGESWLKTEYVKDPKGGAEIPLNEYFARHPEMMLGTMKREGTQYRGDSAALIAHEGQDLGEALAVAIARLPEKVMGDRTNAVVERSRTAQVDTKIKTGSMFIDENGDVSINMGERAGEFIAEKAALSATALERARGLIGMRDVLTKLRGAQLSDGEGMEDMRAELNKLYDAFVKKHGPVSADANRRVFGDDPTWPQLAALEDTFDKGVSPTVAKRTGEAARPATATKAAIFSKRTQSPYKAPTKAGTAQDALTASLSVMGRIDLGYMEQLYERPAEDLLRELTGFVFETPEGNLETRDAYLSGNVKAKLASAEQAAKADKKFKENVEALKAVQPADIEAADIEVRPGAHWIPKQYVGQFLDQLIGGRGSRAYFVRLSGKWDISLGDVSPAARIEFGTDRATVQRVVEGAFEQKAVTVYDKGDGDTQVLNQPATEAATEKAARVAAAWQDWIFADDARRRDLTRIYNDTFNTTVQREYDGSHLSLPGKVGNDIIRFRPHQLNGVWRILQSNTTLLDHVVGAGKTFTMVAAAMEMRRMGFAKKPMLTVPNHLVGQWAEDFIKLYPGAKILAATKRDFEAGNRKKLFARIATGDWDAVIVGHSSIGRIELDKQFQLDFLREQVAELEAGIAEIKEEGGKDTRTVKQAEKQREALRERMERLADTGRKDDNLTLQEMGVDALLLDEAHEFKNLFYITGQRGVMGLGNPAGSQKAMDMFMKVRAIQKRTGGRNIVFATGTPISNTMAEMFTVQRYLDYDDLKQRGLLHFDTWSRQFADATPDWELSPTGNYKLVTRFRRFVNMPELMQRYLSFGDVISREDINRQLASQGKKLPVPKIKGGKPKNVVVERSPAQAKLMGELIYRAEHMPKRAEKGADNMLKIMSDARKGALDMRLIDPNLPDYPGSKANVMIGNALRLYKQWERDRAGQLIFIDLSTPKAAKGQEAARIRDIVSRAEAGDEAAIEEMDKLSPDEIEALNSDFSVYDDVKAKLIQRGVPEAEIAFIHDANTELQKEELFGKVRSGRVRFLLGSTAKMGAGMNVQERLVGLHHLDAPWRPSDLEQREGRIIRQGNVLYDADPEGFEIEINRYASDQTLDSRMWQTIEQKATFIEQVRKGNAGRVIEDIGGESMNAAEMKAASSGNPDILAEMTLRKKVRTLENQKREHERDQSRIRDSIVRIEANNEYLAGEIPKARKDASIDTTEFAAKVGKQEFEKISEWGEGILTAASAAMDAGKAHADLGSLFGVPVTLEIPTTGWHAGEPHLVLHTAIEWSGELGENTKPIAVALSMRKHIRDSGDEADRMEAKIAAQTAEIPALKAKAGTWPHEAEFKKVKADYDAIVKRLRDPKAKAAAAPVEGTETTPQEDAGEDVEALHGADTPMPKYVETFGAKGVPARPTAAKVNIGSGVEVELPELDKPIRREGIRTRIEQIIGTRLYVGKIKGKSMLGFYRKSNSEVRTRNYDDVEVLAHEMAHYLDFHYANGNRFASKLLAGNIKDEVKQLSYTSDPKNYVKEGFAEFVRLWLTQYRLAGQRAPLMTAHFESVLSQDKVLEGRMHRLQADMHKWFLQGPHAQLRAKSGEEYTPAEQVVRYMQSYPAERFRQETIDKIHAAKVIERTLKGEISDATRSAYKQFQMVNGAESIHESIVKDGTVDLSADGASLQKTGMSLTQVFWPVAKKGWKEFDLLMDYFKARRAAELTRQHRENLFTPQEIKAGLDLGDTRPEFAQVFTMYQRFNERMLNFYTSMGLLTKEMRKAFSEINANYVPFHRIGKMIEDGNRQGGTGSINKRLKGGTANVRDIAENIVEGVFHNVRMAMIARAKATLYSQIMKHQDGALFAAKIGTDSQLVKVRLDDMASNVAGVMVELGLGITDNGVIVTQPGAVGVSYDVADITAALHKHPELLEFWQMGLPPKTDGDTMVDSAIIDGDRVYFEVREPLLVDMLTGMRGLTSGAVLKTLFRIKNLQTRTVTSMLQFLGPNAWRDTISAATMSRNNFVPFVDTLVGMAHVILNTPLYQDLRRQGGGYGTRVEARTEETRSRRTLDLPSRNMWDTAAKLLAGYDRFASAFEYGSRMGDYRRGIKAAKSPIEAAWEAREITTDFAKIGRNEFWAKFIRTVPFMNAAIQGTDKTARELAEIDGTMTAENLIRFNRQKAVFLLKGSVITAMTILLWALNNDDDRYKALTDDERARFWWIWIPGVDQPFKIPRPYDVGHIFASIPETMLNFIKDRDGSAAASQMAFIAAQSFPLGDYPGFMQPFIEVQMNKDWKGAPIVPQWMADMPAKYQFTEHTPQMYVRLGEATGVSPLVAQHYAQGYLRYVETYLADATEALFWNQKAWGDRPFAKGGPVDYLTYQFVGKKVPYRTKWTEGYYDLKSRATGMRQTISMLQKLSVKDRGPLDALLLDKQATTLAALDTAFNQVDKAFADQNAVLMSITYDPKLSREEKEAKINDYYEAKNATLGTAYKQIKAVLDDTERAMAQ